MGQEEKKTPAVKSRAAAGGGGLPLQQTMQRKTHAVSRLQFTTQSDHIVEEEESIVSLPNEPHQEERPPSRLTGKPIDQDAVHDLKDTLRLPSERHRRAPQLYPQARGREMNHNRTSRSTIGRHSVGASRAASIATRSVSNSTARSSPSSSYVSAPDSVYGDVVGKDSAPTDARSHHNQFDLSPSSSVSRFATVLYDQQSASGSDDDANEATDIVKNDTSHLLQVMELTAQHYRDKLKDTRDITKPSLHTSLLASASMPTFRNSTLALQPSPSHGDGMSKLEGAATQRVSAPATAGVINGFSTETGTSIQRHTQDTLYRSARCKQYLETRYNHIQRFTANAALHYNPLAVIRWRREMWQKAIKSGASTEEQRRWKLRYYTWHVGNNELKEFYEYMLARDQPLADESEGSKSVKASLKPGVAYLNTQAPIGGGLQTSDGRVKENNGSTASNESPEAGATPALPSDRFLANNMRYQATHMIENEVPASISPEGDPASPLDSSLFALFLSGALTSREKIVVPEGRLSLDSYDSSADAHGLSVVDEHNWEDVPSDDGSRRSTSVDRQNRVKRPSLETTRSASTTDEPEYVSNSRQGSLGKKKKPGFWNRIVEKQSSATQLTDDMTHSGHDAIESPMRPPAGRKRSFLQTVALDGIGVKLGRKTSPISQRNIVRSSGETQRSTESLNESVRQQGMTPASSHYQLIQGARVESAPNITQEIVLSLQPDAGANLKSDDRLSVQEYPRSSNSSINPSTDSEPEEPRHKAFRMLKPAFMQKRSRGNSARPRESTEEPYGERVERGGSIRKNLKKAKVQNAKWIVSEDAGSESEGALSASRMKALSASAPIDVGGRRPKDRKDKRLKRFIGSRYTNDTATTVAADHAMISLSEPSTDPMLALEIDVSDLEMPQAIESKPAPLEEDQLLNAEELALVHQIEDLQRRFADLRQPVLEAEAELLRVTLQQNELLQKLGVDDVPQVAEHHEAIPLVASTLNESEFVDGVPGIFDGTHIAASCPGQYSVMLRDIDRQVIEMLSKVEAQAAEIDRLCTEISKRDASSHSRIAMMVSSLDALSTHINSSLSRRLKLAEEALQNQLLGRGRWREVVREFWWQSIAWALGFLGFTIWLWFQLWKLGKRGWTAVRKAVFASPAASALAAGPQWPSNARRGSIPGATIHRRGSK
ncbi:hypothetical protein HDU85_004351 [Gaertneriomyces sp. JEL0708]|nr:hypothetical protein HDU85_004351 [Gaertneriomyces sp. JEL0708]